MRFLRAPAEVRIRNAESAGNAGNRENSNLRKVARLITVKRLVPHIRENLPI
jgi:hypothetical protein